MASPELDACGALGFAKGLAGCAAVGLALARAGAGCAALACTLSMGLRDPGRAKLGRAGEEGARAGEAGRDATLNAPRLVAEAAVAGDVGARLFCPAELPEALHVLVRSKAVESELCSPAASLQSSSKAPAPPSPPASALPSLAWSPPSAAPASVFASPLRAALASRPDVWPFSFSSSSSVLNISMPA